MARTITFKLPDLHLKRQTKRVLAISIVIVLTICSALFWKDIYVFATYRDRGEREVQRLLLDITPHIVVPNNEVPGLATITDKSVLNQGGVLKDARDGDQLLLYYKAAKAYVYRPSVGKVVAIGPLVVDPSAGQVAGTKIVVRNGSGDQEKFTTITNRLKARYPSAEIIDGGKAARQDYPKTIVIDFSDKGKKTEFSRAIVEFIDAQAGILPIGEQQPTQEMLVIVGKTP